MKRWIDSLLASTTMTTATTTKPAPLVERLEARELFAGASPRVLSSYSDNRGEVIINMSDRLRDVTVNVESVIVHSAGADNIHLTSDDQRLVARVRYDDPRRRILVSVRNLTPNRVYRVRLNAKMITATDGWRLDGEFNGFNVTSGDGVRGGDYTFGSSPETGDRPTARYHTTNGTIDVRLFRDLAPNTVTNFLHYVNEGAYDGTVFHRSAFLGSASNGIIQGGGFNINSSNELDDIHAHAPINNEFGSPNVRGTLAMAKTSDPNSATNQWFFNVGNNRHILDDPANSGGFTVFGGIANGSGFRTMDAISAKPRVNQGAPFNEIPVQDLATVQQQGFNPTRDTVRVRYIAVINRITAVLRPT
jgi:cyclophilin family peptidyl-prolyl cis-trans isomerase